MDDWEVGRGGGLNRVEEEVACVESLLLRELGWEYELKWCEEECGLADIKAV
jgi:hypothetical protein